MALPAFCNVVYSCNIKSALRSQGVFLRLLFDDFEGGGGRGAILIAHAIVVEEDLLLVDDVETSSWTDPHAPLPSCLPKLLRPAKKGGPAESKFSIAVAFLSTKLNMALILRHPLSAMAVRTLRRGPNSSSTNLFLNQSILRSTISTRRLFSSNGTVQITYIDQGGKEHSVNAEVGKSLMDIAHDNNIELEGKCSIQHNIFSFDKVLPFASFVNSLF